jgi:hypothetical protein
MARDTESAVATKVAAGAPEKFTQELEMAFFEWRAENDHFLAAGVAGDLLDLRLRLNTAVANALKVVPPAVASRHS